MLKRSFLLGRGDYTREQPERSKKAARTLAPPEPRPLRLLVPVPLPPPRLLFAVASLPRPHISTSSEAASRGGDWQQQPIPPADHPRGFQGLGAALMSRRRGGGFTPGCRDGG